MIIVDGSNLIFGRTASKIAKELLNNNEVMLINAEKMLISGNPKSIFERYRVKRAIKNKANPEKSARWPRLPGKFVKRLVRGMLPWKKPRGRTALEKLKVYEGVPADMKGKPVVYEDCKPNNISKYTTIGRICRMFGYEGY